MKNDYYFYFSGQICSLLRHLSESRNMQNICKAQIFANMFANIHILPLKFHTKMFEYNLFVLIRSDVDV